MGHKRRRNRYPTDCVAGADEYILADVPVCPTLGFSDDVTDPAHYQIPMNNSGLSWTPDYGNWPAIRGPYGNGGLPWSTTSTFVNNQLTGTLRIEAENYDSGGQASPTTIRRRATRAASTAPQRCRYHHHHRLRRRLCRRIDRQRRMARVHDQCPAARLL